MVEIQTIIESMSKSHDTLSQIGKANKETVFDALAANSFTSVNVTFDGEGDSGQIDNIAGFVGDVLTKLPECKVTLQYASWGDDKISTSDKSLADGIEHLCYDFLEQEHGGWENNDGAFGEFSLSVAERTVALEFHGRYTDIHTSTHTF
jgi:hypothetical protein